MNGMAICSHLRRHLFERLWSSRWAWIPQVIVLLVLAASAGKHFDTSSQSTGESAAITAGRLSFFSLSLSNSVTWAGTGSDFYVYVSPLKLSYVIHTYLRDLFTIRKCYMH